jgi:hypothetical protein
MMIPYINSRMVLWSEWVMRREDGALGYPKECPYTRLMARSGGSGYQPNFDSDAREIDNALAEIKKKNIAHFSAIVNFYGVDIRNGHAYSISVDAKQLATQLSIHKDTLYSWIDKCHRDILDLLHENDAIAHRR